MGEFKKIIAYPYKEKAMNLLFEAQIFNAFPELKNGLNILKDQSNYKLNYLEFFGLCYYMDHIDIPTNWRFSNKEKAIIEKIIELVSVTENDSYNEMIIYRLGKDIPLMANNVSRLIHPENDQEAIIVDIYKQLPIYKTCDLKFKGDDILKLTTLKNAEVIGTIIDDITYQVITNRLQNDYDQIKNYVMKLLENKDEKR